MYSDRPEPVDLEVRKRRHGHHSTEANLERPVLIHSTVQVDVLDVFLQPMQRKDIVPLGRGVLFKVTISIQRHTTSIKPKLNTRIFTYLDKNNSHTQNHHQSLRESPQSHTRNKPQNTPQTDLPHALSIQQPGS